MLSSINGTLARSEEGSKVLRDLRYRIITRNIEQNTKITEMELCEQYNVSRTPARQIIQQLTNEGLLVPLDNGCKCTIDFGERDLDDLYALRNYYEHEAV
ncbi:MAG: GntR family transcriptional regulator, partial [Clostridia bacterium]|nr:GntR family transcriptional regulator [Clostridia bacterium]